ncbi:TIGR03084 family metal-binding protein [Mycobacteroides abscessus]|uniref:TIGR03084 family metal-binding protein n=3 Tax=Mycobacteroides abscessus TaxID=36809 RepID=UPI00078EA023|nr:TIGR03084 family metal-binding protein [Mycobacteroides abscessus]AMU69554.1 TIGR03084 family protein [Mycobacteroides abscessus]MDM2014618.1 TIGR03084 family metal-binding protein [Mycobacteroides abscessus]MDM2020259.1 TIGR03084 family metal-binding protein [Mycobacteroides abscessus]MDM2023906.1 TIGR03084 family metal-binding protein [Mycobacteroides abscessus]MDM2028823.1 TIGR03084 family metal-binding protein [Mycobacteroides abscessus]
MSLDYAALLAELRFESDLLADRLQGLAPAQWDVATPAEGWNVRDQVSHLAFFDDAARLAITDPQQFRPMAEKLVAGGMDFPDRIAEQYRASEPDALLQWCLDARRDLLDAFVAEPPKNRVPWFGPDMSIASSVTARLMETWAHGHDIYQAVGMDRPAGPGLRSIAHLGVSTFAFSYRLNGLEVPAESVRVELKSPEGDLWSWGPEDATNTISGEALDFVLTVTQRRHWSETGLTACGPVARGWMDIAQAFAGAASKCKPRMVRR